MTSNRTILFIGIMCMFLTACSTPPAEPAPAAEEPESAAEIVNPSTPQQNILFFYDATSGEAELFAVNPDGALVLLGSYAGWRTSWDIIVPGNFGGDAQTDLLLYDRAAGVAEFLIADAESQFTLLKSHSGWRTTWDTIIPGEYNQDEYTDLLLYDSGKGEAQLFTTDGSGQVTLLSNYAGWRSTWQILTTNTASGVVLPAQVADIPPDSGEQDQAESLDEPSFTAEFASIHPCADWPTYVAVKVTNTGSIPFESSQLIITDTSDNRQLYGGSNNQGFVVNAEGCPPGESTLEPGDTRYLAANARDAVSGHSGETTVKLCPLDDLEGECLTQTVQFTY